MALYQCQVLDDLGVRRKIVLDAVDEVSLKANLRRKSYYLVKASLVKEKKPNTFLAISSKVKMNEVITFLRQFAVMIKASIPISDALNVLRNQKFTKAFKKVLMQVYYDVQSGVLLSEAFRKHPKVFPDFFVNMIAIGEESGQLDEVLTSLADYYENDRLIKRKAKSALTYPIILMILTVIVFFFITLFIIPQFEDTISELGGEIPALTRVVMNMSLFIRGNILFIIIGIIAIVLICFLFFKKTEKGKYVKDFLKLKIPFVSAISKNLITARFSKAFIILLGSGMTITDCLENLRKMLGNKVFQDKFIYTIAEVKRGRRIAVAIENTKLFPPMLSEMINVGEKSGNIEEVLRSTSTYFDDMVNQSIAKATTAIEPLMIIFLGFVVGIVILSVLLPIISLMQSI